MILNLTVERQGLPPARVRWSTDSFTATHITTNNGDPTIAQLIEQINDIIPLEDADWGLEDYTVEVNGFECIHFCRASQVLKEHDNVTIRPLQTSEVRFRALSGRSQISADGRHLIDGVSFGRPFIRRSARPQIRIHPKKRPQANLDDEDNDDYDDEEEGPAGLLMPDVASHPDEANEDRTNLVVLPSSQQITPLHDYLQQLTPQNASEGDQTRKRRLQPAFEEARHGKRVRSALQPPRKLSAASSVNSKNVRFEGVGDHSADATPSTILAALDAEDSEDDDFDPASETSASEAGSESDKENLNPETRGYASRRVPVPANFDESPALAELAIAPTTLTDLVTKRQSSASSPSSATSEASTSSEDNSDEDDSSDDDDERSQVSSSEDETSTSGSDVASEVVTQPLSRQLQTPDTSISQGPITATAPGLGKAETKSRNRRRKINAKLNKLKAAGKLPPNANTSDLHEWQASHRQTDQQTEKEIFEANRQALLDALANGGVELASSPVKSTNMDSIVQNAALANENTISPGRATSKSHYSAQYIPSHRDLFVPGSHVSPTGAGRLKLADNHTQDPSPETKRRRIDLGASQRLLFGGLGLRAPKEKADEDKLREKSQQQAREGFQKHQKCANAEPEREADASVSTNHDWKDHIDLKSVECTDSSIQYSTPPFPFEQRWDPQQHYNNWRPRNHGKNKKKGAKRKLLETDIEEHYDATMYDERPVEPNHAEIDQITNDSQSALVREQPLPTLDVSDKIDLLVEQALVGAKIAFKQLEVSEATGWQPQISAYRTAIVTSNEDGFLTLSIDEQYRVEKEVDPETGELVASRFIIAEAQESEDDGILELEYSDLIEPKLLVAALTPVSPQYVAETLPAESMNGPGALVDILNATSNEKSLSSATERIGANNKEVPVLDVPSNKPTDSGFEFNTEAPRIVKAAARYVQGHIDAGSCDEASLLIRNAGFRSGIDPEVTRPFEERHEAIHPNNISRDGEIAGPSIAINLLDRHKGPSEPTHQGNSSVSQSRAGSEGTDEDDQLFFAMQDRSSGWLVSVDKAGNTLANAGSSSGDITSSGNHVHSQRNIDIVSLQDSSEEAVGENLRANASDSPESGASTPELIIHHPAKDIDLAQQTRTGKGTNPDISRASSADAAPIGEEDVEEVTIREQVNQSGGSQDSLPDWESMLDGSHGSVALSQPSSRPAKVKKTYGSASSAGRSFSATQTESVRKTRKTARRATAVANTISLLSDDEDVDPEPSTMPVSTAPAAAASRAINAHSVSATALNKGHGRNTVDLAHFAGPGMDSDNDDDDFGGMIDVPSLASKKSASSLDRLKIRKSKDLLHIKSQV